MKIVQSYWSGPLTPEGGINRSPLWKSAGWLAPEYYWLSWALSVCQLRQFYDEVELVTDAVGKNVLIDILQLPYTNVQVVLDEALAAYPHALWALSKIYAYHLQNEPFLHVDGDVYVWKRFEGHIEQAPLVAQNFEVDFPFYRAPLNTLKNEFQNVPACMFNEISEDKTIFSSNAGVIGGQCFDFFKEYKQLALGIIDSNAKDLPKIESKYINICFEQFLYYCLAKEKNVPLSYVIDNQGQFDPTYPGFANFYKVPYDTWYIHCMAEYKRQEPVLRHLAKRLRQDYPAVYYHVLRVCQQADIVLHNPIYQTAELSPDQHETPYFLKLPLQYATFAPNSPPYVYGKGVIAYEAVETLYSLPFEEILNQKIKIDPNANITEETEPVLKQTLQIMSLHSQVYEKMALDNLDMILYDAFLEANTIEQAIEEIGQYFTQEELQADYRKFQDLVLDRIKAGLYLGALVKS